MPRGRPKKIAQLQANDPFEKQHGSEVDMLTEDEIRDAAQPYVDKGVKLKIDDELWYMTLNKKVYNVHGKVIGSGDVTICGNRHMPVRDLQFSARELFIEITPGHV
jgi:hypothetical protein